MSQFYQNSIFWIDVDKIKPNPYQPRREFNEEQLKSLSDSIRQYGVLQALVVTRKEFQKEDGGIGVEYELIAGERRLRASKMAGLLQVPVLIKVGDDTDTMKLELAIIENLQREDLNVVDRALAFKRLIDEFNFKHYTIAHKIGKSRVYVTNTLRVLQLPDEIIEALKMGKIAEGHTRPLLMLVDRKDEQTTLFKRIINNKLSVRDTEIIARNIAIDRARIRGNSLDIETREIEGKLMEALGARVSIEKKIETGGGRLSISYDSEDDLKNIFNIVKKGFGIVISESNFVLEKKEDKKEDSVTADVSVSENEKDVSVEENLDSSALDDRSKEEIIKSEETESDEDLYSIKNFSV